MGKVKGLEGQLLDEVAEAIHREAGLRLTVKKRDVRIGDYPVDAIIEIEGCGQPFAVEVKKWAPQANLGALINQVKNLPLDGILAVDYVNPKMAERLKEQGVQFIDTAGNVYINRPPLYVYVKGNREIKMILPTNDGGKRAFEPSGLKIIFALLCNPTLAFAPYRDIGDAADVALGTVGWVLNGLKATNFIIDRGGKNGRRLVNYKKLFDRWIEWYPEKLRPKLKVGEFIAKDPYWREKINIKDYGAYWGGEVAAAKYTDYLKPEETIVYLPKEACVKFLQAARLGKAARQMYVDQAKVTIYRPFWKKSATYNGFVHPVLAYADMVAVGDPRNLETAKIIYEKYIAEYCREN